MLAALGQLDSCPVNWAHPLNHGLVAWYLALPQWRGNTWRDLVGLSGRKASHGAIPAGPTWQGAKGRPGGAGALGFDGSASVTYPAVPTTAVDNLALAAWIRPHSDTFTFVTMAISLGFDNGVTGDGVAFGTGDGAGGAGSKLTVLYPGVAWGDSGYTFAAAGVWYHVLVTRRAGTTYCYVNGVRTASTLATTPNTPTEFRVGGQAVGRNFKGSVDDVRVWSRALSAEDAGAVLDQSRRGHPDTLRWVRPVAYSVPAAGGTTTQNLAGSCTATGALARLVTKPLAGSCTVAGALARAASKPLAGSLTATGALAKQARKPLAGSVTASGAESHLKVSLQSLAGSLTPAGTLARATSKPLAGSAAPSGTLAKAASKPLGGSATPAGALAKQAQKAAAGFCTVTGATARVAGKALAGSVTITADLAKAVAKGLAGSVTITGALSTSGGSPSFVFAWWQLYGPMMGSLGGGH